MAQIQNDLILYYVQDEKKKIQLEVLCMSLGLRAKQLKAADVNKVVGALADIKNFKAMDVSQAQKAPALFYMPELIIFSGLSRKKLNEFVDGCKGVGLENIKLKAVLTPQNIRWTLYHLVKVMQSEVEKIKNNQ